MFCRYQSIEKGLVQVQNVDRQVESNCLADAADVRPGIGGGHHGREWKIRILLLGFRHHASDISSRNRSFKDGDPILLLHQSRVPGTGKQSYSRRKLEGRLRLKRSFPNLWIVRPTWQSSRPC